MTDLFFFAIMILIFITIVFFLAYAGLIIFYRQSWLQIPFTTCIRNGINELTTISVIISARNEEKNIRLCIDSIINQNYPQQLFEIIVIDDHSTDATAKIIQSFNNKNVLLLTLKDFIHQKINSYKKKGIEIAVSKAKGELIVTTDADCIAPPDWLKTFASFYEKFKPVFIAAPVIYSSDISGDTIIAKFFKIFQTLDFMTLQGITGASVYKRFHSMCNGANLAYRKEVFFEVNGFSGIDNIASGDDMLLMHKMYRLYPDRIMFLKSVDAIIKTKPVDTINEFINQRIRWASKADKYSDKKITAVLFVVYLVNLLIFASGIISIFYHGILPWFMALLFSKTLIELFFLYPVAKFFDLQKLLWWFPVAQPFHILYTIIAGWLGKFGSYKWKGRQVK